MASVSKSLTKAEKNYVAQVLECLAIVFACGKLDQYIYGKRLKWKLTISPWKLSPRNPY